MRKQIVIPKIKFLGNIFLRTLELFSLSKVLLITGATQIEKKIGDLYSTRVAIEKKYHLGQHSDD